MSYPILNIYDFGEHLLKTGDLDPVYIMLNRANLDFVTKARFCLAYWCLYHVGAAAYIACQGGDVEWFWAVLLQAARNDVWSPLKERWPRGKERRHWRGKQALQSWEHLVARYHTTTGEESVVLGPEHFVATLKQKAPELGLVFNFIESHRGFGPWMSFKIADMLEQVFATPVDFTNAAVFMFKDPKEAALRFWRRYCKLPDSAQPKNMSHTLNEVVEHLVEHFRTRGYCAPNGERLVGLPEIETILCKWKSHENGHYPLNNDIHELRSGLGPWTKVSPLAALLLQYAPEMPE